MQELLRKIYDTVILYEEGTINKGIIIDDKINSLAKSYQNRLTALEQEELKTILHEVALFSEREGFILSAQYTVKILTEVLTL